MSQTKDVIELLQESEDIVVRLRLMTEIGVFAYMKLSEEEIKVKSAKYLKAPDVLPGP